MLLTTQYLEEAEQLADDVCVLDGGRVVARGTPDELTAAIGGDRLELVVADPARAQEAAEVAARGCSPVPRRRPDRSDDVRQPVRVTVPVARRHGAVGAVVRALDAGRASRSTTSCCADRPSTRPTCASRRDGAAETDTTPTTSQEVPA